MLFEGQELSLVKLKYLFLKHMIGLCRLLHFLWRLMAFASYFFFFNYKFFLIFVCSSFLFLCCTCCIQPYSWVAPVLNLSTNLSKKEKSYGCVQPQKGKRCR